MKSILTLYIFLATHFLFAQTPSESDFVVDKEGTGDFTTIQAAIDAAPNNSADHTLVYIKNGVYEEALNVASGKRNIILYGESNNGTIITYKTEKTLDLATLEVYAAGFIAYNLTLENTAGPTYGPAQSLRQEADKSIYINCRLTANQDTYRTGKVRSYSRNCYYEGTVDFIFGDGKIVFEDCDLYSKGGSAITAASTRDYSEFGYIFRNCRVVSKKGTTTHLGRPWKDYAAVAFINTELPEEIKAAGWHNWDQSERETTSRFVEYMSYGPGAKDDDRVSWATILSAAEAESYNTLNVLKSTYASSPVVDNWNPYEVLRQTGLPELLEEGDGYGRNAGGNGGTEVTVETESGLRQYALSNSKYIINIKGEIELTQRLDVGSNTTITGINESSGISGATVNITDGNRNVIIKHLNITNPDGDGISVWDGDNVFISHISFYDCGDGSCDINRGSDSVTVSWCKFYYPTQEDHRFTMIADGEMTWDNDGNVISYGPSLNVTLHHNWWYSGSDQRMPAATNTKAHMYNNYFNCVNNSYSSNARIHSEFYSESNVYDHVNDPIYGENGGVIYASGNIYNECFGKIEEGAGDVDAPEYSYMLTNADYVSDVVTARAGNRRTNPQQYTITLLDEGLGRISPKGTFVKNEGMLYTIEATPFTGNVFSEWLGDKEGTDNPMTFFIDDDYEVTATFEEETILGNEAGNEVLVVYPNPSNGFFYLDVRTESEQNIQVFIYNLNGKLLYQNRLSKPVNLIEIKANLDSGMYVLKVLTDQKNSNKLLSIK